MAAELKDAFGAHCELLASHGGVFEVTVDNKLTFSKRALRRFPEPGEVLALVRANAP